MDERRHDLDWLRVIAFGLLILYHVGMFYVSWDWHVKSSRASDAIEPLMRLTNPWRLTLLFLIAGAASRFLADKLSRADFTKSRMKRLLPPLLLAVFVIVPPQRYYEVAEALQALQLPRTPVHDAWLDNFYVKYITASGQWCDQDGCLITPTYNHMWFVAYMIVYTLALVPLIPLLRRLPRATSMLISGAGLFIVPWAFTFLLRMALFPLFGETHELWNDWYLHALYFSVFVFGFAVAKSPSFFERCANMRWVALVIALMAWAVLVALVDAFNTAPAGWSLAALRALRELQAWTAIVALIGFAHRHLRAADGPLKRLLTKAIFSFYLIHQTIIVVVAHYLDNLGLPLVVEMTLLVSVTLVGCWYFFDVFRRVPALRIWIGLPRESESSKRVLQTTCKVRE